MLGPAGRRSFINLVQSRNLPGPTREQAKEAVYLAQWTRGSERNHPIRLLLQFNFLSWPDTEMLQHILAEGNLTPFGDRQRLHSLASSAGLYSNAKKHYTQLKPGPATLYEHDYGSLTRNGIVYRPLNG